MSKRANGEGSITKRSDGRWQGAAMIDGVRKTVYGKTRQEVRAKLTEVQRQAAIAGALPTTGIRTVGDLLDAWLGAVAPNLRPTTREHYALIADTYIRPTLGAVRLGQLNAARIQRLYASLQDQGHTRAAVLAHCVLNQACSRAVRWHWLIENPVQQTIRPTHKAERKDVWSLDEMRVFLESTATHWLGPLWAMGLATGCRLGELLALTWADVNWSAGSVTVTKTLQRVNGKYRTDIPKTETSRRVLAVPQQGMAALHRQRMQQAEWRQQAGSAWESDDLVFTGRTGRPLHRATVAHAMQDVCNALGIPALSPHGLRHMHASVLLCEGLPIPVVSARLGHANPSITMSVYAHTLSHLDEQAAQMMATVVKRLTEGSDAEPASGR